MFERFETCMHLDEKPVALIRRFTKYHPYYLQIILFVMTPLLLEQYISPVLTCLK